ncbi:MAG: MFS transporter [Bdellovibrionales bacterium]|nr:MFS transporter [Bdellovibrionales bacterium]
MFFIILAGETVFMLPFLIPRLYRPLMLEGWNLTNTDLGVAFAAYGFTSTISYLFGGVFADKYHPRFLISISLALTSFASLFLVLNPSSITFISTYAFFGVSTVFLLWGALIKTTHVIGGEDRRSSALGVLDGGRGFVAAMAASLLLVAVSFYFPNLTSLKEQQEALRLIYFSVAAFTFITSLGVWWSLKSYQATGNTPERWNWSLALKCLKNKDVWLLSVVILASYCGYKGIDNYSIYLVDVHGKDLATASSLTSIILWLRPASALLTGVFADHVHRRRPSGRFFILFVLCLLGGIFHMIAATTGFSHFYYAFGVLLMSSCFVYGLRAVYFSIFGDLRIENYLVGTTIGIASFVGFLPDFFFGYICGVLIDANPGSLGYSYAFIFTAVCLFAGAFCSYGLYRQARAFDPSALPE